MTTENRKKINETAYIIEPYFDKSNDYYISEIKALAESAGASVYGYTAQQVREITPATFIGSGKLREIREELIDSPVDLIIFDGELSPSQTHNIAEALGIRTIDRTTLILDIFALNAKTAEGKLQVELAQLKYIYPRLKGKGGSLSQQGGGIGTRGPGETQLESDRRHIRSRINFLEKDIKELATRRRLQSDRRRKNGVRTIALVGYTNAGKSTILNKLTGADVLTENRLFATLDPTMRKLRLEDGEAVLTDTVGFVRNIPHNLVEAFKSTLESAVFADLILIVCDASGDCKMQLETTYKTLEEIGATAEKLVVYNKCDLSDRDLPHNAIKISALTGEGMNRLMKCVNEYFSHTFIKLKIVVPYTVYGEFTAISRLATIKSSEFKDDGVHIVMSVPKEHMSRFKKFID